MSEKEYEIFAKYHDGTEKRILGFSSDGQASHSFSLLSSCLGFDRQYVDGKPVASFSYRENGKEDEQFTKSQTPIARNHVPTIPIDFEKVLAESMIRDILDVSKREGKMDIARVMGNKYVVQTSYPFKGVRVSLSKYTHTWNSKDQYDEVLRFGLAEYVVMLRNDEPYDDVYERMRSDVMSKVRDKFQVEEDLTSEEEERF